VCGQVGTGTRRPAGARWSWWVRPSPCRRSAALRGGARPADAFRARPVFVSRVHQHDADGWAGTGCSAMAGRAEPGSPPERPGEATVAYQVTSGCTFHVEPSDELGLPPRSCQCERGTRSTWNCSLLDRRVRAPVCPSRRFTRHTERSSWNIGCSEVDLTCRQASRTRIVDPNGAELLEGSTVE
jgi:hypothetical protein